LGNLAGRVAIVTGAGRGIGRAIALKLASEGARVVVSDLDEAPALDTVDAIRYQGGEAEPVVGDVTAETFPSTVIDHTLNTWDDLHIVVNNAGYIWNSSIQKHTDEQWYAMLDIHATAPFRLLRAAGDYIREAARDERSSGEVPCRKVVNISSTSGLFGSPTQLAYSAGKSAMVGVTRTLAKEWGRYNVCVNCVAFGFIETRLTQPFSEQPEEIDVGGRDFKVGLQNEQIEGIKQAIPLGRAGSPEEAAGAVYLLCTPESDYISGQVLVCSGGWQG
jgi:3-oxoacyl-[acyl-carrier protein] reductase